MAVSSFLRWTGTWRVLPSIAAFGALCSACGGSGETQQTAPANAPNELPANDVARETRSVCLDCPGLAGGESSDFGGGNPHPCTVFEQRFPISDARALELGFDMARVTALIEREIDAPLRWTESAGYRAEAPTGYQPETRIEGRARRGDWLTYVALDVERCPGNLCYDADYGEWECSDRLELGVVADLRTLDGAVNATVSGYVLQGRPGMSFETPAGSQFANLRDVTGSLELSPPGSRTVLALLVVDLFFNPEGIAGDMRTYFSFANADGTSGEYAPLSGHWPDVALPPGEPPRAGPDPDSLP